MERAVLRVATVAALLNGGAEPWPTVAGGFVYDSMMDNVTDVVPSKRRPVIIVRTDEDQMAYSGRNITGRQCRLLIEIGVLTSSMIKVNGQDHERIDWPRTDSALEAFLDMLEWQVWNALMGYSVFARWYRERAGFGGLSSYLSTPRYSAPERGAVRLAVRTLSMMTNIGPDCLLRPVKEFPDGSCTFEPELSPRWVALICELQMIAKGPFKRSIDELAQTIETYGKLPRPAYPQLQRVWGSIPSLEIETMIPIRQEAPFCPDDLEAEPPVLGTPGQLNALTVAPPTLGSPVIGLV